MKHIIAVYYRVTNEHGGFTLDFVDFNSRVPPVYPFVMPTLPNFLLPEQIWAVWGTNHIKVNKM